jgi:Tfp pilus assembly protein PilF
VGIACGGKSKEATSSKSSSSSPAAMALDLKDANRLLAQKRCAEAAETYRKYLDRNPKDPGAWNMLGLSYLCDQKNEFAIESFKRALEISPTYTDVHNNLGVAYMEAKNYEQARGEFAKALQDSAYPASGPYFNLAKLSFLQGNYEESRALAKKVMELVPKVPGPILLYALSLEKLGRIDEACESYRSLLKIAPDNLEAAYYLANLLVQKNQNCEAREYFRRVIDTDPLGELGQKSIAAIKNLYCPQ